MRSISVLGKTAYILAFSSLFIAACKKDANTAKDPDDNCLSDRSASGSEVVEGRYIIAFNKNRVQSRSMNQEALKAVSTGILERNGIAPTVMVESFGGEPGGFIAHLSATQAQSLRDDPSISHVEQDRVIKLSTCFTVVAPHLVTWGTRRVGYGDGTGKTAWVIDSGIDLGHPDLNVDISRSRSYIPGQNSADDGHGHGTHVAGIIGAKNNNFGMLGVASGANLVSLRVLDENGSGLLSYIIQALAYINTQASPGDVVNMSLADDEGVSPTLDQQVQNLAARGILFSLAAGNEHTTASSYSPGRTNGPGIYTVSAIDSLDNFAGFSNYGNDVVDFAAPGVRILSTFTENRYAIMSGTSMAAPHVAGLLLLRGNSISSSGSAKNDPDGNPDPIAHY